MIRECRFILFDLGNTLFFDDSTAWPRIYERAESALWQVLMTAGVRTSPGDLYEGRAGLLEYYYALRQTALEEPGTARVLGELLARKGENVPAAILDRALRAMYAVTQTNWQVEHDAATTLRALLHRGYRLGAVSNGSDDRNALDLLDRDSLRSCLEVIVTSAACGWRKPDARIFRTALDRLGADPGAAVMVGDSYEADIIGASGLGMQSVWITRRVPKPLRAASVTPSALVQSLEQVPPLFA